MSSSSRTKLTKLGSGSPKTPMSSPKSEIKGKAIASSSKTVIKTRTETTKRTSSRAKTVYSLTGQKFDTPEERAPLRIFYESLSRQTPTSEMAEFWLMEHGMLSPKRAKKAYEKKQKRQQQIRMGTPISPAPKKDKPESSKKPKTLNNGDVKAKKRAAYTNDDDDFVVKPKRPKI